MDTLYTVDFYRDWMIELVAEEGGFRGVCYAPSRQRVFDRTLYSHPAYAMVSAQHLIDWHLTCHQIAATLRECFEADQLTFDEWRSLHQSLINQPFPID